jgi:hypothetical protein
MKLSPNSQLGLNITRNMVGQIIMYQWKNYIQPVEDVALKTKAMANFVELFSKEMLVTSDSEELLESFGISRAQLNLLTNTNYLMATPALELAQRIKIDEDKFDVRFLSKVKDKKITFLLGKNGFIRFMKHGDEIFAIMVSTELTENSETYMKYCSFKVNTGTGVISYMDNPNSPLSDEKFRLFIQLLIFTELSELEVKILKPKEKTYGTRKEGKFVNESSQNVTIVDSTWNKIIIRTEGFAVRGHFRLQPCGEGFTDRKLLFISEFQKNGYIRRPKGLHSDAEIENAINQ